MEYNMNARPEKIVNLLSAILVLVAGFYVIIFMPLQISPLAKILIGALIVIYFLLRLWYFFKKSKEGGWGGHRVD
jgi:uncharacterized membrane protein HdeD (DUF308 family)